MKKEMAISLELFFKAGNETNTDAYRILLRTSKSWLWSVLKPFDDPKYNEITKELEMAMECMDNYHESRIDNWYAPREFYKYMGNAITLLLKL